MAIFSSDIDSFEGLFIQQIEDLYDAENQLTQALPKMADAANSTQLKQAFTTHLRETQNHVQRLEQIFQQIGRSPKRETCKAMKGLVSEGEEMIKANAGPGVKDAGLIAAAQRVEHYEMAGYGTARTFAERLGHAEAARLLQATLTEEQMADKKLTTIAEQTVNPQAASSR
jgi:ferritin-like metal-binding protein YciE